MIMLRAGHQFAVRVSLVSPKTHSSRYRTSQDSQPDVEYRLRRTVEQDSMKPASKAFSCSIQRARHESIDGLSGDRKRIARKVYVEVEHLEGRGIPYFLYFGRMCLRPGEFHEPAVA